jgi:hypothetical protein
VIRAPVLRVREQRVDVLVHQLAEATEKLGEIIPRIEVLQQALDVVRHQRGAVHLPLLHQRLEGP